MSEIFALGADIARLGAVGLLGLAVVVIGFGFIREWFVPGRTFAREVARGDRAMAGWEGATTQFERALDVIERMQDRRRRTDEAS